MMQKIKRFFLNRNINNNKVTRIRAISDIENARSIGILCEIESEEEYKQFHRHFTNLQNNSRSSWLIGYHNNKQVPYYCLEQLTADYFCNKNLNWYGKPSFPQLHDFLQKDFDIVIDFSKKHTQPIEYILALSHAKFIIGIQKEHKQWYDLYIDTTSNDWPYLLKQIDYYTKQLTGKNETF